MRARVCARVCILCVLCGGFDCGSFACGFSDLLPSGAGVGFRDGCWVGPEMGQSGCTPAVILGRANAMTQFQWVCGGGWGVDVGFHFMGNGFRTIRIFGVHGIAYFCDVF